MDRLALDLTQFLQAGQIQQTAALLLRLAADPEYVAWLPFLHALQANLAGSRDHSLADAPRLYYDQAAEITILIETLQRAK